MTGGGWNCWFQGKKVFSFLYMGKINAIAKPIDMAGYDVDTIASHFYNLFSLCLLQKPDLKRDDFYCGITNSIPNNLSRHEIDGYFMCVNCASQEDAGKVESKLGEMGFDIGNPNNSEGNGGVEDSTIVYMAYKETGFKK